MHKKISYITSSIGAILFGFITMQGQNVNETSATVQLTLIDILSIDNSNSSGTIDFNFQTSEDYNTGKNITIENNITVSSTTDFDIKVKAEGTHFLNTQNEDRIPVQALQIKAVAGGTMEGRFSDIILSNEEQMLVSNATLGMQMSLNIQYTISAEKSRTVLLGKQPGTYTQRLTYIATAL